jgi:hypothetical protein
MILLCFGNVWTAPLLFGKQPEDIWTHDARVAAVHIPMGLQLVIGSVCLFTPIRSCALWVLPAVGFCTFGVVQFVFGSAIPDALFLTMVGLGFMFSFAYYGSLLHEQRERQQFLAVKQIQMYKADLQTIDKLVSDKCVVIDAYESKIREAKNDEFQQHLKLREQEAELQSVHKCMREQQLNIQKQDATIHQVQAALEDQLAAIRTRESLIQQLQRDIQSHKLSNEKQNKTILQLETKKAQLEEYLEEQQAEIDDQMGPLPELDQRCRHPQKSRRLRRRLEQSPLDGRWVLVESEGLTNSWLHSLQIAGDSVLLGDGTVVRLQFSPEGRVMLEGGILSLDGLVLSRVGKTGRACKYRLMTSDDDQCTSISIETDPRGSDIADLSALDDEFLNMLDGAAADAQTQASSVEQWSSSSSCSWMDGPNGQSSNIHSTPHAYPTGMEEGPILLGQLPPGYDPEHPYAGP